MATVTTHVPQDPDQEFFPSTPEEFSLTSSHTPPEVLALRQMTLDLRNAALDYARRGWPALPLHRVVVGRCSCRSSNCQPGKHPDGRLVPNGFQGATTDELTIKRWWKHSPFSNVGIALPQANLFVIAPDSVEWHEAFQRRGLPSTAVVQSGGGEGHYHYYYRRPAGCPVHQICLPGRYDLKTHGFMVAPPSWHASGRQYQWLIPPQEFPELPEAPAWAVEELAAAAAKQPMMDVLFTEGDYDAAEARSRYREIRRFLSKRVALAIESGPATIRPTDRSGIDFAVVLELVLCEVSDDLIRAFYQHFPIGQQGKYQERGDAYLATTIRNARAAVEEAEQQDSEGRP